MTRASYREGNIQRIAAYSASLLSIPFSEDPMNSVNKFRTPQAAAYIGLSASTLEKYRLTGEGPAFHKSGPKIVIYEVCDLDEWLHARRRTSTSDRGALAVAMA